MNIWNNMGSVMSLWINFWCRLWKWWKRWAKKKKKILFLPSSPQMYLLWLTRRLLCSLLLNSCPFKRSLSLFILCSLTCHLFSPEATVDNGWLKALQPAPLSPCASCPVHLSRGLRFATKIEIKIEMEMDWNRNWNGHIF